MRLFLLAAMAIPALPVMASPTPLRVVPSVDLTRYAGMWYEIARLPNRLCAGEVVAAYELPDGRITVTNRCRRLLDGASGQGFDVGKVVETRQQPSGS